MIVVHRTPPISVDDVQPSELAIRNNHTTDHVEDTFKPSGSLMQFMQSMTQPLNTPLLDRPEQIHQSNTYDVSQKTKHEVKMATRCSPRIQSKIKKHKPALKLAQEVLAKKWGIVDVDKELEELTLKQYLDIYRKPLSQQALAAVRKLTEVAAMNKKKKEVNPRKKNSRLATHSGKTSRAAKVAAAT
jgi:hypothetical protein